MIENWCDFSFGVAAGLAFMTVIAGIIAVVCYALDIQEKD